MCNYGYCNSYCKYQSTYLNSKNIYRYPDSEIKDFSSFSDNIWT